MRVECRYCGALLPYGALFCGECGRRVNERRQESGAARAASITAPPSPEPPGSAQPTVEVPLPPPPPGAMPDPFPPPADEPRPFAYPEPAFEESTPDPGPRGAEPDGPPPPAAGDDESTVVVARTPPSSRPFSLVVSTGQRFEVRGRTLLGRKPVPLEGERYDAILVIVDPGKTVSKTHLELLVVAGELMALDVGSGNGTIVHAPAADPVRCERGMPQPVPRGSRIVLGHQWIMVE